jgi:hypothetical protein
MHFTLQLSHVPTPSHLMLCAFRTPWPMDRRRSQQERSPYWSLPPSLTLLHHTTTPCPLCSPTPAAGRAHLNPVNRVAWAHPEFGQIVASCSNDKTVGFPGALMASGFGFLFVLRVQIHFLSGENLGGAKGLCCRFRLDASFCNH